MKIFVDSGGMSRTFLFRVSRFVRGYLKFSKKKKKKTIHIATTKSSSKKMEIEGMANPCSRPTNRLILMFWQRFHRNKTGKSFDQNEVGSCTNQSRRPASDVLDATNQLRVRASYEIDASVPL